MLSNNLISLSELFKNVSPLYIVGGFIRDKLLNKNSLDIDLCSALTLYEVENVLKDSNFKLKIKNKTFGTASIYNDEVNFEYSVFRKDTYSSKNAGRHSPKKVEFVDSLKVDAQRRDFTINSIYYNLCTGELIDLFNAKNDIECKKLKMVTPTTLNYDGERILRLVRFVAELNFSIDNKTLNSAKQNAKNVLELSKTCISKFLNHTKTYSKEQQEKAKKLLDELDLSDIGKLI